MDDMSRHQFTPEECRRGGRQRTYRFTRADRVKGGKVRAREAAAWRIEHPTQAEANARAAVALLTQDASYEHPVETAPGLVQYLDIYCTIDGRKVAVEVDGSNGWHNPSGKMANYDECKARWCHASGIALVIVTASLAASPLNEIARHIRYQLSQ